MAKRPANVRTRILDAALKLAAEQGWRGLTLGQIAEAAKVSLARLQGVFPGKTDILIAMMQKVDGEMLADAGSADMTESAHDRLFDVVMRRLDALEPHKPAVTAILRDMGGDPVAALPAASAFLDAMAWMLEAAGIGSAGPGGRLRAKGLGLIYLSTLCVWARDDSEDLGPTMAHLDRRLNQAARLVSFLSGLPGARRSSGESEDAA